MSSSDFEPVQFIPCDFGNLAKVKEVADKVGEKEPRIDIVRLSLPSFNAID